MEVYIHDLGSSKGFLHTKSMNKKKKKKAGASFIQILEKIEQLTKHKSHSDDKKVNSLQLYVSKIYRMSDGNSCNIGGWGNKRGQEV